MVLFVLTEDSVAPAATVQTLVRGAAAPAETLLAYLDNGVFATAHRLSERVVDAAVEILRDKREDPFGAALAGYLLLRTGKILPEKQAWMRNLRDWFPLIPDGPVVCGTALLRAGDVEGARENLLEAVIRGIPTYTIGLRMLFDALSALAEEREGDTELATALAKVRAVTAYADWTRQTTTLTYASADLGKAFELLQ
jgi:hypothetical protein